MKELNYMTASQSLVSGNPCKVESNILPSPDRALILVWLLLCPRPGFPSCLKLRVKKSLNQDSQDPSLWAGREAWGWAVA